MRYISICTTLKVYLNEPHQDAAYIPTAALLRVPFCGHTSLSLLEVGAGYNPRQQCAPKTIYIHLSAPCVCKRESANTVYAVSSPCSCYG